MKKFIYLLAIILVSCNNNSFEKYNEWCNEVVMKEKIEFSIIAKTEIPRIVYSEKSDTIAKVVYGGSFSIYNYNYLSTEDLNDYLQMEFFEITKITPHIVNYMEKRCEPTIKGYNEWLKNQ